ncbi:hypothetical protein UlMin_019550 [Ulmus minor]
MFRLKILNVFEFLGLERVNLKQDPTFKVLHQPFLKVQNFTYFQARDALIQLYHNFIIDFETKINLLKLAHFAVIVSRQYPEKEAKLRVTREQCIKEPILYIKMQIAIFKLEQGDQKECKKLLDNGKSTLNSMTNIDPSVYANYYWVSSQYYKICQEFVEFYKSALLYLAYTSVESLLDSFKLIKSLIGSKVEWLYKSIQTFYFLLFSSSCPLLFLVRVLGSEVGTKKMGTQLRKNPSILQLNYPNWAKLQKHLILILTYPSPLLLLPTFLTPRLLPLPTFMLILPTLQQLIPTSTNPPCLTL